MVNKGCFHAKQLVLVLKVEKDENFLGITAKDSHRANKLCYCFYEISMKSNCKGVKKKIWCPEHSDLGGFKFNKLTFKIIPICTLKMYDMYVICTQKKFS